MPFTERTVQPAGIELEGLHYFGDALRPWIRCKAPKSMKSRKFVFTFDPRDLSRLFFFDEDAREYMEVPLRDSSKGSVSLWEVRSARKRLQDEGRRNVKEPMLFAKIVAMRSEIEQKAAKSKHLRREKQRIANNAKSRTYISAAKTAAQLQSGTLRPLSNTPVVPFDAEKL